MMKGPREPVSIKVIETESEIRMESQGHVIITLNINKLRPSGAARFILETVEMALEPLLSAHLPGDSYHGERERNLGSIP